MIFNHIQHMADHWIRLRVGLTLAASGRVHNIIKQSHTFPFDEKMRESRAGNSRSASI